MNLVPLDFLHISLPNYTTCHLAMPKFAGLRSLTLLLAVRANTRREVKNTKGGPRAAKDHVFKDRKMGQALLEVCPTLEKAQQLHYLESAHMAYFDYLASQWSAQDCFRPSPSVYWVNVNPTAKQSQYTDLHPLAVQFQYMYQRPPPARFQYMSPPPAQFPYMDGGQQLVSILILSEKFQWWAHSLEPPAKGLLGTTFPRARTWLLAVDEDMKEEFKAQVIKKIEDLCKTKIDFEEVAKVEVRHKQELDQDPELREYRI